MNPRVWLAAAAVGLGLSPAVADDPPKKADPPPKAATRVVPAKPKDATEPPAKADDKTAEPKTLAEKVASLRKQYNAAMQTYSETAQKLQKELKGEDYNSAENKPVLEKLSAASRAYTTAVTEVGDKLAALAKENPKDPAALDAIQTAIGMTRSAAVRKELVAILTEHHLGSPKIADLLGQFMYDTSPDGKAFLKAVAEKATDPKVKGTALYATGFQMKQQLTQYGKPATDAEFAELAPQVEKVMNEVIEKYGSVQGSRGNKTLGKQAADQLAGLKNIPLLRVGKVAPDITGEDIDGKAFKLSDYRGKVVMLDFWGDW